ncbi:bifunctional hydroxymethylpyrimidine kinase/phosphomethylpyrimidine kinase [Leuconostoc rapi]|uniref:bifunctional hydroxymethylpyrimidine kinase/phosphomethylpyrimidine kinase n=1 Tax=Leuconostoc rapi TaxID=1406906 RepID=UPI00195BA0C0|nr:bifunctional hydroxymethylpyrimidine kinase/phosphomethylpyrimidine kinase [Leuconostoc rapi]MBM7436223.1 hydroxymethylpyrimidine/phosphomethylpyrimidine kinase [Leuconostoc rapi]
MANETPQVMTIAGTDSSGGAGMSADLKTFFAQHVYGANVVVSVTAQNTFGVQQVQMLTPNMVTQQLTSVGSDLKISAFKTGMLGDAITVHTVAAAIEKHDFGDYILDPVMIAKGGARLLTEQAIDAVISDLLPLATLVTPNLPEAEVLAHSQIKTHEDVADVAKRIQELGAKNVLLKGGHGNEKNVYDYVLLENGEHFWMKSQRVDTVRTHGTGDTISAAITAQLALGKTLKNAIITAKAYVDATIRDGIYVGHGHGPLNHSAPVRSINQPEVLDDL